MENILDERYELATCRIREIKQEIMQEKNIAEKFQDYFYKMADFLEQMIAWKEELDTGDYIACSLEELQEKNRKLYEDILPEHYEASYGNPAYAVSRLGEKHGQLLSFLYTELRGTIVYAFEGRKWDFVVCLELFLQVYSEFLGMEIPDANNLQQIFYWYVSDYSAEMIEERIAKTIDADCDVNKNFTMKILMEADLTDLRYLYRFGEYVTAEEEKIAGFLNTLPEEEIWAMACTYTEGYRIGFEASGKDIRKKKTVNIRYRLGFERMIRAAVQQFAKIGLQAVIYRSATHSVNKRQHLRVGYYGAIPNPQYEYDHRNDAAIYLDDDFVGRKLRATQGAYEKYKAAAAVHGGPAVVETFGETPFAPAKCEEACTLSEKQQKLQVHMYNELAQITNRYIKGQERSFTIIAYPVPTIGAQYEAIFRETVKINTLDYDLYQKIQQKMIDALDLGVCVWVKGKGANRTDLRVQLHHLNDPEKETNFENCVADVNIPVGEVFTSPVLKGTNGILHVSEVFLNELQYKDLELEFVDGKITKYSCGNFASGEENEAYIRENLLYHHKTLPLGEFAIGTNTTAYKMAKTYQIHEKLPILIAEKMGPHFAVGDTCYSFAEDQKVYNSDGKEIVAKDNEVSLLRKTDPSKAYFGCHTDITIPYDELDCIYVETAMGDYIYLIQDGKFVLNGTEILNDELV